MVNRNTRLSDLGVFNVNIEVTSRLAEDPETVIDHFTKGKEIVGSH